MQEEYLNTLKYIQLMDVVDILVSSAIIYITYSWLRKRTTPAAMVAIVCVCLLYLIAHKMSMYLTSKFFEVGIITICFGLFVIFQKDIRSLFERLATWSPFCKSKSGVGSRVSDILCESIAYLSDHRIGALFVISREESVSPHLRGGVGLNGEISIPLILSIFDPRTPGHDGALVIVDGKVSMIGAHLPLSKNSPLLSRSGTRHAAALGLCERCDAQVIVVSEETGTISIAEKGSLYPIDGAAGLKAKHLLAKPTGPQPPLIRRIYEMLLNKIELKLGSIAGALVLWLSFAVNVQVVQRTYFVPVQYRHLPENWYAEEPHPMKVKLTLSGSERAIEKLNPTGLGLSADLGDVGEGENKVPISREGISLAQGVSISEISPSYVTVRANPLVGVTLPIRVKLEGQLDRALVLGDVKSKPATISISLPKHKLSRVKYVETTPVDLSKVSKTTSLEKAIILPMDSPRTANQPLQNVNVSLNISRKLAKSIHAKAQ